jgi:hypothetical protein
MPTPEEMIAEEEEAIAKSSERITGWAIGLTAGFGVSAFLLFVFRGRTRENESQGSGASSGKHKEAGYFAAWVRAIKRRGLRNETGLTIRRQVDNMDDAPDFSKELVRYHYAVRYEGLPLDAELERCLEKEIDKW